ARDTALAYLSTTLSHPSWLAERWLHRHGFEAAERWCTFNNTPPAVVIRPTGRWAAAELLSRLTDAGVTASAGTFVRDAIVLGPGGLAAVPAELRGAFIIQDEASQ